ncbi:MAG TPA: cellulose binding domain-containing protein, partial [Gammaproteobacteria bacterium]
MSKRKFIHVLLKFVWTGIPVVPALFASAVHAADCEVGYDIVNDWGAGFQVNITVTNNTSAPVSGYTLAWDMTETLTG